jgi:hypothetical protein
MSLNLSAHQQNPKSIKQFLWFMIIRVSSVGDAIISFEYLRASGASKRESKVKCVTVFCGRSRFCALLCGRFCVTQGNSLSHTTPPKDVKEFAKQSTSKFTAKRTIVRKPTESSHNKYLPIVKKHFEKIKSERQSTGARQ